MAAEAKMSIPTKLLVLDAIGTVLLGLGLAKHIAHIDVLPAPLRFDHDGIILIIAGGCLMIPLIFFVLSVARAKREAPVIRRHQ